MLRKAAKSSVCKINIDSDIRLAMTAGVREALVENEDMFDPRGWGGEVVGMLKNWLNTK